MVAAILKGAPAIVLNFFANPCRTTVRVSGRACPQCAYLRYAPMHIRLQLPFAALALPPAWLAGSIRAYIIKDTTGSPQREGGLNRYPASVYCGIAWFLEGNSERVDTDLRTQQALPTTLLLGPQTQPWVTRNPGPVRTFGVVFYPQAFHHLTGLDISTLVDRMLPAQDILPPDWLALCEQVRLAQDDTTRMTLLEEFVTRQGQAQPAKLLVQATPTRWLHELQSHVSANGLGGSLRSLERHARTWAGQSLRRLGWLSRAETTLVQARQTSEASGQAPRWQDVALDAGYADQSHLCREAQRVTGQSPAELARRVQSEDESYWLYRLWS